MSLRNTINKLLHAEIVYSMKNKLALDTQTICLKDVMKTL